MVSSFPGRITASIVFLILAKFAVVAVPLMLKRIVDELSRLGPETVSMVSDVASGDPTQRTFKILRKAADGRSHAMSLAKKHGLTYERVVERVRA